MTKLATDIAAHRNKRHRFPAEIIAHAVWLYHRCPLSLWDVEDLLGERGIDVSFQTVSEWAVRSVVNFAHHLRRRSRGNFADKWHLDEMVVSIKRKNTGCGAPSMPMVMYSTPPAKPAKQETAVRLMRKLLKGQGLKPHSTKATPPIKALAMTKVFES